MGLLGSLLPVGIFALRNVRPYKDNVRTKSFKMEHVFLLRFNGSVREGRVGGNGIVVGVS